MTSIQFNTFENYVLFDSNECVEYESDLSDQQIVDQILNDCNEESIQISDEEQEECEEIEPISSSQALSSINALQRYFGQIGDKSVDKQLIDIQRCITQNTFKTLKQTKITDFFSI